MQTIKNKLKIKSQHDFLIGLIIGLILGCMIGGIVIRFII